MALKRMSRISGKKATAPEALVMVEVKVLPGNQYELVLEAQRAWDNMDKFRRERERNRRYVFGEQWSDLITVDGDTMTEADWIRRSGSEPMSNNLMQRVLRNVVGIYRNQNCEPVCYARDRDEQVYAETLSTLLETNRQRNRLDALNSRTFMDYLIGGAAIQRKFYGWRNGLEDCWTDYVNPQNWFVDTNMRDFRGWDCSLVGEIHDVTFNELLAQFAKSPGDFVRLRELYAPQSLVPQSLSVHDFGHDRTRGQKSFLAPEDPSMCRVIEVWKQVASQRMRVHDYNTGEVFKIDPSDYEAMVILPMQERMAQASAEGIPVEEVPPITAEWFIDNHWEYFYLTPTGDVIASGETPYAHGSHPYIFTMYPFIDGEIHSMAHDIIDQQRYVNKLITMYDFIIGASAKGVLMVPEDSLPDNVSPEDFAAAWKTHDGVLFYKAKPGVPVPHQVASNSTGIGLSEMLQTQLKLLEDISGVNGAMQGKQMYSGMAASLYAQMANNGSTSLIEVLEAFNQFVIDGTEKDAKNIQQFYTVDRIVDIAGKDGALANLDLNKIKDIDYDISIVQSQASPVYRAASNELSLELWRSGVMDAEDMLECIAAPYADKILQKVQSRRKMQQEQQMQMAQAQQQGAGPEGVAPDAMAEGGQMMEG